MKLLGTYCNKFYELKSETQSLVVQMFNQISSDNFPKINFNLSDRNTGKTTAIVLSSIEYAATHLNKNIVIFSGKHAISKNILDNIESNLDDLKVEYKRTDIGFRLTRTNSKILCFGDYKANLMKGMTVNTVLIDNANCMFEFNQFCNILSDFYCFFGKNDSKLVAIDTITGGMNNMEVIAHFNKNSDLVKLHTYDNGLNLTRNGLILNFETYYNKSQEYK